MNYRLPSLRPYIPSITPPERQPPITPPHAPLTDSRLSPTPSPTDSRLSARQLSSVAFPSMEAALLSLAFLTFIVFIIDLLQVTHRWSFLYVCGI